MKIVRRLLLIGSVVACHTGTSVAQTAVQFADPNLETVVRVELAKPVGPLTQEDLANLESLSAGRQNIIDLTGLEWATNLVSLDLSGNMVGDISALAGLAKLSYLELRSNPLTNFSGVLSGLTNLGTLYLGATSISNVEFLQNLKQLRFLNLDHNKISDLSPLTALPDLSELDLSYNPMTSFAGLSSFTNLQSLYLSGNAISNLSGIPALNGLVSLTLYNNAISDVSPLAALTNLDSLGLSGNPIGDYSPLGGLTNLRSLWLDGNAVSNLDFVVELRSLTILSVSGGHLSDLNALGGLTNLFAVFADYNRVTNIEGIHELPTLYYVRLVGNRLELTPGSPAIEAVQDLLVRGVNVVYQPQNEPPGLFCPSDWFISTNAESSLRFYMLDDVTSANRMILEASSSNTGLIPTGNIGFDISDGIHVMTVTPVADQTGTSLITIVATDEAGVSVSATVRVTVVVPETVNIPDPNLDTAVRFALGKATGELNSLDLLELTYLEIADKVVTNLAGLERATNLMFLRLDNLPAPDLSPLTSLSNLAGLHLQGATFDNLSPLQQLLQLNTVELDNNRISDLSPLAGLTNLAFISLRQNRLTNINALQTLPHLMQVNVNLNLLDLSPGSPALMVVEDLEDNEVTVSYLPQRSPPALSLRPSWVIKSNVTSALSFGLKDAGVIYNTELAVALKSSNTNLLPDANIIIGKSTNADWFMYVTPGSNLVGTGTITLSATNDVGMGSSTTMQVTVVSPLPLDPEVLGGGDLSWVTGGSAPWFGQTLVTHDGISAAQSGSIQNSQQTWMQTEFEGPGILSYWWKVSSELNFDWLEFRINGQLQPNRISGQVDWQRQTHSLPLGRQVVRWRFFKEAADSGGLDTAWVGEISFLPLSWLEVVGSPTNGQCQLSLHLGMGRTYLLQSSTNLTQWVPLGVVMATNGVMPFVDVAANVSQRFYRLQDLSVGAIRLQDPKLVGNEFHLELHSPVGLRFEVQSSTNLTTWAVVGLVTNTLGAVQITEQAGVGVPWRFYRASLLLP